MQSTSSNSPNFYSTAAYDRFISSTKEEQDAKKASDTVQADMQPATTVDDGMGSKVKSISYTDYRNAEPANTRLSEKALAYFNNKA